ncbi:hypothetical protein MD484_g6634, partial [Candolleomyces efflorescens]
MPNFDLFCAQFISQLTPEDWRKYSLACRPDVVVALADTPFTNPPYSQKRLTKSIERSTAWIASLVKPVSPQEPVPFAIFAHLAGNTSISARKAFSNSLVETLYGPEAEAVKPYSHLDQAIAGYTVDLIPLFLSLAAAEQRNVAESDAVVQSLPPPRTEAVVPLVKASLEQLPIGKPRLVNSTQTPHEILRLISSIGVDLFDAHWAQRAADVGIALDFRFPVARDGVASGKKVEMGHNIYDLAYAHDFSPLADSFRGASQTDKPAKPICICAACSPIQPPSRLYHGVDNETYSGDPPPPEKTTYLPPFTRAYVHHLLHTHEMSAHSILAIHNLAVLETFFAGVREVLHRDNGASWEEEVALFMDTYDEGLQVLEEAKIRWKEVDLARGKGRLAREKAKEEDSGVATPA